MTAKIDGILSTISVLLVFYLGLILGTQGNSKEIRKHCDYFQKFVQNEAVYKCERIKAD